MNRELTLDDVRLAARVAATLDHAAERDDAAWDARMESILTEARKPARKHRWHVTGSLALAASVTFMLALPGDWLQQQTQAVSQPHGQHVDGQMLDQIDWLMSMEASSREGR